MDKKLLLTIQSVCNAEGVKIPWDKVGVIMGEHISDGAVIQHLAKLRSRMVTQGLDVPPPLRRGGGIIISTGPSGGNSSGSKLKPTNSTKSASKRGRSKINVSDNDDEDVEYDVDKASDSDEEYEQARSKRSKPGAYYEHVSIKNEDDESSTPNKAAGNKRKRRSSSFGMDTDKGKKNRNSKETILKEEMAIVQIKPEGQTPTSTINCDGNDDDKSENVDYYKSEEEGSEDLQAAQYVGSGAGYLRLDSQSKSPVKNPTLNFKQEEPRTPSKIVVLSLPGHRKYSGFEQYPQTPEYKVQADSEFEVGLKAGTNHNLTPDLASPGLTMKSAVGNRSATRVRPVVDMNSSVNMRSAFEAELASQHPLEYPTYNSPSIPYRDPCMPHPNGSSVNDWISRLPNTPDDDHLHQGFPTNQNISIHDKGYGDNNSIPAYSTAEHGKFGCPPTYQNLNESLPLSRTDQRSGMTLQSSHHLPSNSSFYDSGGHQYMLPIQHPGINTPIPKNSSNHSISRLDGQGTQNHHPAFGPNFDFLDGNQEAQKAMRFDQTFVIPSQPARPSVVRPSLVTRQPDQPNVLNEPFSATSTLNNPTPILATAGDADGEPVLDFSQYVHDDFDESLLDPMTSADMIAEFENKDFAVGQIDEGNGGVV